MTRAFAYDLTGRRVFVAGHGGMVGSAIVRRLASEGCTVLYANRSELDLSKEMPTLRWLEQNRPDVVIHGGDWLRGDWLPCMSLSQSDKSKPNKGSPRTSGRPGSAQWVLASVPRRSSESGVTSAILNFFRKPTK